MSEDEKIKISWTDLESAPDAPAAGAGPGAGPGAGAGASQLAGQAPGGGESWGRVAPIGGVAGAQEAAVPWWLRLVYKPWFYLTMAGLVGAFGAWALCEPFVADNAEWEDNPTGVLAMMVLFPLVVVFMCTTFSTIESAVERSWAKAVIRGAASFLLGLVLSSIFFLCAGFLYSILMAVLTAGVRNGTSAEEIIKNPVVWVARSIAWSLFGVCGGLVYGIVSLSWKRVLYGVLGGLIGGAIGGFLFDPIAIMSREFTEGAALSRCVGISIIGAMTGLAIGIVEDVAKSAWVQILAGRLVGKQFILYRNPTRIGSLPANEIYLFKDKTIASEHAHIEKRGNRFFIADLQTVAGTMVNGRPVRDQQLKDGDLIQIGETVMRYGEKTSG